MHKYLNDLLFVIVLFGLFSCGQKTIVKKYYILDYSTEESAADSSVVSTRPYSVRIDPFLAAGVISSNKIAIRKNSNELQYYFYHFWAENPATAIRYFLFKKIKQSMLFGHCVLQAGISPSDYLITGRIDHLERFKSGDKFYAHLDMSLELHDIKTGKTLVRHSFDRLNPMEEDSPMNVFAKEISAILHEETLNFMKLVRNKLK